MEDSDGSNHEDVWSPTLREDVFSNHDMMGHSWSSEPRHHVEHLPLPNFNSIRSQPLNHINWPNSQSPQQQQRGHNNTAPAKPSSSSSRHPLSTTSVTRNHSHLDLPNFPLQAVCLTDPELSYVELLVSFIISLKAWCQSKRLSIPLQAVRFLWMLKNTILTLKHG